MNTRHWAVVFIAATLALIAACGSSDAEPTVDPAVEARAWKALGQELLAIPYMNGLYLKCYTNDCRDNRFIAAGRILTRSESLPESDNKRFAVKVAAMYSDTYKTYAKQRCYLFEENEVMDCDITRRLLDEESMLLPKAAHILSEGLTPPVLD